MTLAVIDAVHICRFRGKRVPPPKPEYVTCKVTGRTVDVTEYPKFGRCDGEGKRGGRCRKKATTFVTFVWGGGQFCDDCANEECGP